MSTSLSNINPYNNKPYTANYERIQRAIENLPVVRELKRLAASLEKHNVLILIGETGSGKTTQFPKYLLTATGLLSDLKLALTQNRRLAASSVAERIAEELDTVLGTTIGVLYRGRALTTNETRFEVLTDGTLLGKARSDKDLSAYGVIVIDEAHQHTIQTDLLLGLLKTKLQSTRSKDLKVVIMSATLDAKLFNDFYPGSKIELVEGRQHQVLEEYLAMPASDVMSEAATVAIQCALLERSGNILIFAPGVPEIHKIIARISRKLGDIAESDICPIDCYALHAKMSHEDQDEVVGASPPCRNGIVGRKVIVATNVAEASITINDVAMVIDTGLAKKEVYDVGDDCWRFLPSYISKAEKKQRVGRAGRQKEGIARLLYTEGGFHREMIDHPVASIMEDDMVSECLTILAIGQDPLTFPYITPPATETINRAMAVLRHLTAVTSAGVLARHGEVLNSFPLDLHSAETVWGSPQYGCSDEIISIIAMIEASEGGILLQVTDTQADKKIAPQKLRPLRHPCGDHLTFLNVYMSWRTAGIKGIQAEFCAGYMLRMSTLKAADRTRDELLSRFKKLNLKVVAGDPKDPDYYPNIVKALAAGNFLKVAMRVSDSKTVYKTLRAGKEAELFRNTKLGGSLDDTEFVLYHKHVRKDGQPDHLQLVTSVRLEWLISTRPEYWLNVQHLKPGDAKERLVALIAKKLNKSEDSIRGKPKALPTQ